MEYNGVKVLSPAAIREMNCIRKHIEHGCLSRILPGRGKNRNERLHRQLNQIVHNTRLGVELGYALITCTFYEHNERIRATKEDRVAKPITARITDQQQIYGGERFGLATTPTHEASEHQPVAAARDEHKLTLQFTYMYVSLTTRMRSAFTTAKELGIDEMDVNESISKKEGFSLLQQTIAHFYIAQHLSQISKSTTIDPCSIFFTSILSVIEHCSKQYLPDNSPGTNLDRILGQWHFKKIPVQGDGNCLFTAVSLNILDRILNNDQSVICALERFDAFRNIQKPLNVTSLSKLLRYLVVQEWRSENYDYYQGFVTIDILSHAEEYLSTGAFLGDLIVVTLAHILHTPITIFSNIPNLSVTPVSGVDTIVPLYLIYDHNGPGHYDYAAPLDTHTPPSDEHLISSTRCFCGRKKDCSGTTSSSDMFGKCRCPCAQKKQPCSSSCRCKNCSNRYGIRSVLHTRRRACFNTQKQPLSGSKGSDFLEMIGEQEKIGHTTMLERLLITVILIHFMVNGMDTSSDNIFKAYSTICKLVSLFLLWSYLSLKEAIVSFLAIS